MNKFLKALLFINSINIVSDYLLIPIFAIFVSRVGNDAELVGILFAVQFISSAIFGLLLVKTKDGGGLNNKLLELNYILKALAWFTLAFSQNIPTLIVTQILIGIASAIGAPAYESLVAEHLDKGKHISEESVNSLSQHTAVAVGSVLSGFVFAKFGFTYLFIVMALLEVVALALYYSLVKRKKVIRIN